MAKGQISRFKRLTD